MLRSLLILSFCFTLTACDGGEKPATLDGATKDANKPKQPARTDVKLEEVTIGDLKLQKFGNVYLAAQPSETDLAKLKEAGLKTVINLRGEGENTKFDEGKALADLGIEPANYHNPGFNSAQTLSDPIFRRVRDLLTNKTNEPVLLHCASGNRVGAVWMAHRILDDGVSYEKALEEAKAIGMKPQAFEARVKEYVESKPE